MLSGIRYFDIPRKGFTPRVASSPPASFASEIPSRSLTRHSTLVTAVGCLISRERTFRGARSMRLTTIYSLRGAFRKRESVRLNDRRSHLRGVAARARTLRHPAATLACVLAWTLQLAFFSAPVHYMLYRLNKQP